MTDRLAHFARARNLFLFSAHTTRPVHARTASTIWSRASRSARRATSPIRTAKPPPSSMWTRPTAGPTIIIATTKSEPSKLPCRTLHFVKKLSRCGPSSRRLSRIATMDPPDSSSHLFSKFPSRRIDQERRRTSASTPRRTRTLLQCKIAAPPRPRVTTMIDRFVSATPLRRNHLADPAPTVECATTGSTARATRMDIVIKNALLHSSTKDHTPERILRTARKSACLLPRNRPSARMPSPWRRPTLEARVTPHLDRIPPAAAPLLPVPEHPTRSRRPMHAASSSSPLANKRSTSQARSTDFV